MTELSPSARVTAVQAIKIMTIARKSLTAFNDPHELCSPFEDRFNQCLAAAIEALADQVVPADPCGNDCCITQCEQIRSDLLAIAAELRGDNTTETP